MRLTETVKVGESTVTVKELTMEEVQKWIVEGERAGSPATSPESLIGPIALQGIALQDIIRMSDATMGMLMKMTYSELAVVVEVCKRLNPPFFRILEMTEGAAAAASLMGMTAPAALSTPAVT